MWKNLLIILGIFSLGLGVSLSYIVTNLKEKPLVVPIDRGSVLGIAENIWLPLDLKIPIDGPNITAKAAYVIDASTGQVLYERNSRQPLPIASLTKIMTAIVALEHQDWQSIYTISPRAAAMEPDSMLLKAGEKLTLEELLYGIFLVSGNDASEAIAEGTTGRREEFINLMNQKAKQIGMSQTHFINPSGLQEDDVEQYSTAYDVALMGRYIVNRWPRVLQISSQPQIYIPATSTHQDYTLPNGINLVTTYPGVMGLKTGFTPDAGLTLVTVAEREGHLVVGVLLNCTNRRDDAKALLDYSFTKLGV